MIEPALSVFLIFSVRSGPYSHHEPQGATKQCHPPPLPGCGWLLRLYSLILAFTNPFTFNSMIKIL